MRRKLTTLLFISLAAILISGLAFSGCARETPAPSPVLTDPIEIESGYISGIVRGEAGEEVHVYRGIPYAAPPVGDLRWKPPQPVTPWSGTRVCTTFSDIAPQILGSPHAGISQSEDCLYLNVLTPAKYATDRLPVMVWMHGGGYVAGHGNETLFNALPLPQHGVVLVTVNMRLGVLGLMAHPLLSQESPNDVSGNYMCLDMIAALQWVQKNIAAFGGDPDNVTIFGESGGSRKVIALIASPLAEGLFHKAIGESGVIWGTPHSNLLPLKDIEAIGEELFARLGVDKEADPLAAARALSWEKIIEVDSVMAQEAGKDWGNWDITVDGWFMPDMPANIFQAGEQNAVPFIVGGNLGEITGPGTILMPEIIPTSVEMFSGASKAGVEAYAYIFDQVPSKWRQEGCIASHAMELPYVFGAVDIVMEWASAMGLAGAKSPDAGLTEADRRVSEAMMSMWTQFAKTGNPSVEGLVTWPAYEATTDQYLYITDPLEVRSGFSQIGP